MRFNIEGIVDWRSAFQTASGSGQAGLRTSSDALPTCVQDRSDSLGRRPGSRGNSIRDGHRPHSCPTEDRNGSPRLRGQILEGRFRGAATQIGILETRDARSL